jgi:ubiquinone biosynthesis protein
MVIQPQLILLQKTLLNIEGLGRQLYDELDIWHTAAPILREWMQERVSVAAMIGNLRKEFPEILEAARALPPLLRGAVQRAQDGKLRLQVESQHLDTSIESLRLSMEASDRRRSHVTIGAALLGGGLVWMAVGQSPDWVGWALTGLGALWSIAALRR